MACNYGFDCSKPGCPFDHPSTCPKDDICLSPSCKKRHPSCLNCFHFDECLTILCPFRHPDDVDLIDDGLAKCRYGNKCSKPGCVFWHPHLCPRGVSCLSKRCTNWHPGRLDCFYRATCKYTGCPFDHPNQSGTHLHLLTVEPAIDKCRYGNKCSKPDCVFGHPHLCPRCTSCLSTTCTNWHPGRLDCFYRATCRHTGCPFKHNCAPTPMHSPVVAPAPSSKFTVTVHEHPLELVDLNGSWFCDGVDLPGGCRKGRTHCTPISGWRRFKCSEQCDYDLCSGCLEAWKGEANASFVPLQAIPFEGEVHFAKEYKEAEKPDKLKELVNAVKSIIKHYDSSQKGKEKWTRAEYEMFFNKLTTLLEIKKKVANDMLTTSASAVLLWTSGDKLGDYGFYHMLNDALRDLRGNNGVILFNAAIVTRAINCELVTRHNGGIELPPKVYRGSGLPLVFQPFFQKMVGQKFRIPMYFATTSEERTASRFCSQAAPRYPPVKWIVEFPKEGCVHVNSIDDKTAFPGEKEYLFPPYSVFTVQSAEWVPATHKEKPHRVTLMASPDNKTEPDSLPIAPWA